MTTLLAFFALAGSGNEDHEPSVARRHVESNVHAVAESDMGLFARIRAGDASALDALARSHGSVLEAIAFTTVRDADLARDIVQDVLFDLWCRRTTIDVRGQFLPYIRRAVHHRAVTVVRGERARRRTADLLRAQLLAMPRSARNAGEANVETDTLRETLIATLAALPPRCREVFLLHREAGLDAPRIAATLGISVPTVYNQLHRALKAFAEAVARLG